MIVIQIFFWLAIIVPQALPLFNTLAWWWMWSQDNGKAKVTEVVNPWRRAIVFLTGVSDFALPEIEIQEQEFLNRMAVQWSADTVVRDPFPFDTSIAQRFRKWDLLRAIGFEKPPVLITSLHNWWQACFSAFLPGVYGRTAACCLLSRLGPPTQGPVEVIFLCGSCGASVALAMLAHLKHTWPEATFQIVTYGGVFPASANFGLVDKFYHGIGSEDSWAVLNHKLQPGRWRASGALHEARQSGRFIEVDTGPHEHFGPKGYLSHLPCQEGNKAFVDHTIERLCNLPLWKRILA